MGCVESCTIRAHALVMECQADSRDREPKASFAKNTRDSFMNVKVYMASIHLAWEKEPNHDRISQLSRCCLQATREDLLSLKNQEVDPAAQILTIVIDVTTDMKNLHLVKAADDLNPNVGSDRFGIEAAWECMGNDLDGIPGQAPNQVSAELAAELAARRVKDSVPFRLLSSGHCPACCQVC